MIYKGRISESQNHKIFPKREIKHKNNSPRRRETAAVDNKLNKTTPSSGKENIEQRGLKSIDRRCSR